MVGIRVAFVLLLHVLQFRVVHGQKLFAQSGNSDELLDFSTTQKPGDTLELSSLSSERFTRLSHPYFPRHSARIKKSNFCDETVQAYTGYLDIGTRHLFFYFFESRNDPDTDDVMLWTNGGPGGSSSVGLFMELGPCNIVSPNKTVFNPFSWNSNANIFFIDQPVGVGFSYADFGETVGTTEEAAKDIAAFVAIFFETFHKFKGRGFHLSGESYAGRYLPVYASEIYDQNAKLAAANLTTVNLKSVLIGNGQVDFFQQLKSYYHMQCTGVVVAPMQPISTCVRMQKAIPRCEKWTKAACVDHFDLMECEASLSFCETELILPYIEKGYNPYDVTKMCCYEEPLWIEQYLNQPSVRSTLGIDSSFGDYSGIAFDLNMAFTKNGDMLHRNQLYIAELLERGVRVLIYAGTYDWICNWIGNERWTLSMEWSGHEEFASLPLRGWQLDGKEVGKTRKAKGLIFATVFGGGHMVPHDKPAEALAMVNRWLVGEDL
ncbi:alpha/beta-hydrolase [Rickenella mellea]|uniref:Carboxypeptidase n=1 Tax=Rickenella mellea TaxID=50990 RepID=A0A4Y7PZJ2_9AGAM|nr:alpha/beta-hydrolase [Rickenella mellea]